MSSFDIRDFIQAASAAVTDGEPAPRAAPQASYADG